MICDAYEHEHYNSQYCDYCVVHVHMRQKSSLVKEIRRITPLGTM